MFKNIKHYFARIRAELSQINNNLVMVTVELQGLSAERSEQLERIAVATEALAEMQRAVLAQSHPHLVR